MSIVKHYGKLLLFWQIKTVSFITKVDLKYNVNRTYEDRLISIVSRYNKYVHDSLNKRLLVWDV